MNEPHDMSDPHDTAGMPDDENQGDTQPDEAADDAAPQASTGTDPAATPQERIATLEAEVAGLKDRLLRAVADAENTRRRADRDKQDASKYAVSSFARDVLSVGDNMRRAIDAVSEADRQGVPEPIRNLIEGVEMTEREFLSVLDRHGVKPITPLGEKFDANLHQAMFEVPDPAQPAGTVTEVVATGYTIGDRLLRPAMVGVAKGGAAPQDPPAEDGTASNDADDAPAPGPDSPTPGSTIDTKA